MNDKTSFRSFERVDTRSSPVETFCLPSKTEISAYSQNEGHSTFVLGVNNQFEVTDYLQGVDLNWGRANREQFYGIAKSLIERLLIDLVDDLKDLHVTLQVSGKTKSRKVLLDLRQEWMDAIGRYHLDQHSEEPAAMDEPKGVANED